MASSASTVVVNNAKAVLPLIRRSLLKRAGANLARDQKLLFAPAPLIDRLSFGQLLKNVECGRPQSLTTASVLLDSTFGFSIQDMQLRPLKEASVGNEDEFDDDSDDFDDDDDELYDEISDDDDSESEEEEDAAPTRRK